ncbi:MAG TPA: tRNA (adenosine(37)-N6)-threonylcarbamoyltransferase complex ATPase subunit type 1 TsaE [Candidatus Parcubacteria bacterium]|jgi:tRNA threonylcarbamoyladenosine biosynthesis protein TsaE|nr:tRNA (adenosine(37)-N6)-threonylcarbamoyltransferase complex ATPase subunit type 1 TsaE [Candidatus Parcubacteria bacterium]|tara:strand:- start:93 stop:542 length:450 start_codon:yes stop_codon:yes gene_type:complete
MKSKYFTTSPTQTKKLGENLAKNILKIPLKGKATILGLEGDLGGGKTTFLQGFARGLGIEDKILSPTFVIMKNFKAQALSFERFYHIDCYRIKSSKEILNLGFKEILSNPKNIIAIEWAERVQKIVPKNAIWIKFQFINEKTRKITISS